MSRAISAVIIGGGEVGQALQKVIGGAIHDPIKGIRTIGKYDVMHVSIPYGPKFVRIVKDYQKRFRPRLTIIHSSVPVGTTRKCNAVHSPIRGVHPHLAEGIRMFVKYFGGKKAKEAAKIFSDLGIRVVITSKPENTEAMKLWDTTQYGMMILLNRMIWDYCKRHKLDFSLVYTDANTTYNEGYLEMNRPEVVRPWLKHMPGKIGGHCIRQNAHLLNKQIAKMFDKSK